MSITGRYEMISSENFGDYLKAVGVGMIQRNLAEKAKPTVEITENGGRYTLKTLTALKNTEINFTLGQEFDEETADGRKAKSTITQEGSKLIHVQKIGDDQSQTVREFLPNEMKATFTAKGVTASRVYKRL
ncbi:unnamed protein product [Orchesella dallaii]|uniref:Lipocalin/cytosolic fatty-acid binding domain-containing protein n=1 Tax=Orchesella dallaii TaxID=48710 RepID=A0ABP1QN98_9HEXA